MKLTDGERLIIVMLAEVMEALKLIKDPTLIKTLVCNNDGWALRRKYSGIFSSEAPTAQEVSETTNILWMWGIIESSLAKLTGLEATEAKTWRRTSFDGFDGNNDNHYGLAHTMINELGEFQDFKDRNLNSHSQATLPRYLSMSTRFDEHVHSGNASPLPFDALRELCS